MYSGLAILFLLIPFIIQSYGMKGDSVSHNRADFMVAILLGRTTVGTGVLYNQKFVITAASYLKDGEKYEVRVKVNNIISSPFLLEGNPIKNGDYDVAVLKVNNDDNRLETMAVLPDTEVSLPESMYVYGWNSNATDLLSAVVIPSVAFKTDENLYSVELKNPPETDPKLYDTFDVGSPLVITHEADVAVIGLAKTVAGTKGQYTKISDVKDWIVQQTTIDPKTTTKKADSGTSKKFPNTIFITILVVMQVLQYAYYVLLRLA